MRLIRRRREHGDLARAARHERKAVFGRIDACGRAQRGKTEKNNGHEYITRERPESRTARHEIAPDRVAPRMGGRA